MFVTVVSLVLGALTAYAQGWLPEQVGSLANSSGPWALLAFLLAMLGSRPVVAAAFGSLSLLALLAGYVLGADVRGYPSSSQLIVFWGAAALLAGPLLGVGASWVRSRRGPLAALGAGAMSGVLVGEGVYGLAYIADTTYPPYWWGQIAVGLALLVVVTTRCLPDRRDIALGVGVAGLTAAAFVAVYSRDQMGLLSR